ncbi:Uncharacterized protein FWK35_00016239 [Aphis craccivora]|uniref:Uncharacterized protein n=1 Tax=Aphis craccivora TaxID=307492 RepID=A0A6G0Z9K2_APHCR|nr:Uncharacterized protein FWK35_00016239 [Aphis craccivora]
MFIKRLECFGHVWKADGQKIKEVLVNKINKKRPLGRPRTRRVDVIAQDIKNIKEESSFDDAYDREKLCCDGSDGTQWADMLRRKKKNLLFTHKFRLRFYCI